MFNTQIYILQQW